jgi:chromosome segregation ATPase
MKCCSKAFVGLAVIAGLGVAAVSVMGVGPAVWHRMVAKFEKQIPPEVQIDQLKIDIDKLDKDMDKNLSMIAKYEIEVKNLKGDLDRKQAKISTMSKELASAADEIEGNAKQVKYEGKSYDSKDAKRLLLKETSYFEALKREVGSKEKLLAAREQKLTAAMANLKEVRSQKEELKTQVAQLEADLETLNLLRTESKLPVGEKNRLDGIKQRLNKLQGDVEVEKRAHELKEQFNGNSSSKDSSEKTSTDDSVVRRIRDAIGTNNNVAKGDE